jgi:dipeptidyl aminopeptidase/acylaminoacyl peptidase
MLFHPMTRRIFIIHGDADMTVPLQQSQTFVAKLKEAGCTNNYIIKKGGRHNPGRYETRV